MRRKNLLICIWYCTYLKLTMPNLYVSITDAWEAISDMVAAGPSGKRGVSSILLSAPGFDEDFALWAGPVFAMLEAGVSAIQAEEMIGVVCFHPRCKWFIDPLLLSYLTCFNYHHFFSHTIPLLQM